MLGDGRWVEGRFMAVRVLVVGDLGGDGERRGGMTVHKERAHATGRRATQVSLLPSLER